MGVFDNNPCKGCTAEDGRSVEPNCHSTCERHLKWKKNVDTIAEKMKADALNEQTQNDMFFKRKRRIKDGTWRRRLNKT